MAAIPGVLALHAESSAHHGERPVRTSIYQMTLRSPDLEDIYAWAPRLTDRCASFRIRGREQRSADCQSRSSLVDIDRDRTLALGVTPAAVQDALYQRLRHAPGVGDL